MTLIFNKFLNDSDEIPIMLRNTHTNYTEAYDCSICIKGTVTSVSTLVSKLVLSMLNNMFVFNPLQAKYQQIFLAKKDRKVNMSFIDKFQGFHVS